MDEHQKALDLFEDVDLKRLSVYGNTNSNTLISAVELGIRYGEKGRCDSDMKLRLRTIDIGQTNGRERCRSSGLEAGA